MAPGFTIYEHISISFNNEINNEKLPFSIVKKIPLNDVFIICETEHPGSWKIST